VYVVCLQTKGVVTYWTYVS